MSYGNPGSDPNHPLTAKLHQQADPGQAFLNRIPAAQRDALTVEDFHAYKRQMLDLAKNPQPGTVLFRGEKLADDAQHESVGMHWTVNPDSVLRGYDGPNARVHVWQARMDSPSQAYGREHPMWQGQHRSMDHEAEVRLKPGRDVHVEGVYTWHPDPSDVDERGESMPGYGPYPNVPERQDKGWKFTPINQRMPVRYRGHGTTDYSDLGIEREK